MRGGGGSAHQRKLDQLRQAAQWATVVDESASSPDGDQAPVIARVVGGDPSPLMRAVTEYKLEQAQPDALIRPTLPEGIGAFSGVSRLKEIIDSGERAAASAIPRLAAALVGA